MRLVIVESPAKCTTIEGYLGEDYKCVASFGHIRELTDLDCIDKENNYALTFRWICLSLLRRSGLLLRALSM